MGILLFSKVTLDYVFVYLHFHCLLEEIEGLFECFVCPVKCILFVPVYVCVCDNVIVFVESKTDDKM